MDLHLKHWMITFYRFRKVKMHIGEIFTSKLIKSSLSGKTKFQVIEELLDLLVKNGDLKDRKKALEDLIEREQYVSTGLENGLAVPHAKSLAAGKIMVSFGISRAGIDFVSVDRKPAHYIFLVLSPHDNTGPHIKILAQITKNFRNGEIKRKLKNANTKEDIFNIINNFK